MESPIDRRDEVIADSEDEDGVPRMVPDKLQSGLPMNARLNLTGHAASGMVPASYEPRAGLDYPLGFHLDMLPSSIADRAKMRQRNTKPTFVEAMGDSPPSISSAKRAKITANPSDNVIELTSDEDDELALRPPKPKPKPKAKAKPAAKPVDPRTPKVVTSSDPLDGQPKARPKPRPIPKRSIPKHATPPPPPQIYSASQVSLPVPTSPVASPIPFRLLSSQLPPSDPPPPTSTATEYDLPHIETLPNPATDFDGPLSSPSSLFSAANSPGWVGKRKRKSHPVDELDSDQDLPVGAKDVDIDMDDSADMRRMLPPPTFFAPSSSSSGGPAQPQLGPEMVDLTIVSPTIDPTVGAAPAKVAKKIAKPKKPRKKKGEAAAQEGDGAVGEGEPKAKGSAKAKKAVKPKMQMEVLITVPASKNNATGKGNEKEKEVFKSKEFIDDDDDDDDFGSAVDASANATLPTPGPASVASKPDSLTSLSSAPDSEVEGGSVLKLAFAKKRKSSASEKNEAWLDELVGSSKKKQKGKQKVIWSSDEEEDDAAVSAAKPVQSKAKGKGKTVIVSEDEDGGEIEPEAAEEVVYVQKQPAKESKKSKERDKGTKKGKAKKGGKKTAIDVEDEPLQIPDTELDAERPEAKANEVKENIEPEPETHVTPDPSSSKLVPDPPKESLFPSLSSRYTIAPRTKSTPMSELIRRVNSLPGSPFPAPRPSSTSSAKRPATPAGGTAYSPYLKSSRSMLSRIAPLHPNRRTPPPPLPPPPPRKKTKKELEMEERWEEELVESVGGVTEWACMTDEERKEARRAKREMERAGWED